jgi:hypothetical protein
MKKNKGKGTDPRLQTPPGHYLKNAPWRRDFIEEPTGRLVSVRDAIVLVFLVLSSVVVAAALWMNPPQILRIPAEKSAAKGPAVLARRRIPHPYHGLDYDPSKYEELKDNDPLVQDDLEDVRHDDVKDDKPNRL